MNDFSSSLRKPTPRAVHLDRKLLLTDYCPILGCTYRATGKNLRFTLPKNSIVRSMVYNTTVSPQVCNDGGLRRMCVGELLIETVIEL